jgi:hypothetical protein
VVVGVVEDVVVVHLAMHTRMEPLVVVDIMARDTLVVRTVMHLLSMLRQVVHLHFTQVRVA